ncbi:MAG: O-acetyl-ADP-ribose deacetylase [Bacteroidetes bacterium]|nr:MAG: O-acetyl-ADP-ribose deacetylase [Bacteroidota bacterium]TAG86882.1 MAG: O-acetyl-ADP-ribose deacetylase [Bacteroidota bacterium]
MIELVQGDITKISVDAIVNAANSSLLGGGGVDGAIHRAGGGIILEECIKIRNRQGGCDTGEAVITSAGRLPAKFVIHTVGPIWRSDNDQQAQQLANCYQNSLSLAIENNCETIAFPNISTGIYHYPKKEAAQIAIQSVQNFLSQNNNQIKKIVFVCFDEENFEIYQEILST